tara:strand:- start:201 stop:842 length:642 start_codon:yes stop_codon:yes gene_type:complete
MAYDELKIGNKGPARDNNNLNEEVYNVSNIENTANYKQTQTLDAIDKVNKLYSGAGYSDVAQFMKNMAATETNVGADSLGDYSFGATQIDPVRYRDIIDRATGSEGEKRLNMANTFLGEHLNRPDFDIGNLDLTKEGHNPYISAALTRMGLLNIPEGVPSELEGQADYWKKYWNTEAGKGTPQHFMEQVKHHFPNPVNDTMDGYNKVEDAFKY